MYFGNFSGILEFDGLNWQTIFTQNISKVSSLSISDGKIFVGARGDIGFLQADSLGRLQYNGLLSKIDKTERNFFDVNYSFSKQKPKNEIAYRLEHLLVSVVVPKCEGSVIFKDKVVTLESIGQDVALQRLQDSVSLVVIQGMD